MRSNLDRDAGGRVRNARPRDALGRPLTSGADGVPRVPDDLVLAPVPALLEGTWKNASADERDLWQGLAQLAVGLTHLRRGNSRGAATLLKRAQARGHGCSVSPTACSAAGPKLKTSCRRLGCGGRAPIVRLSSTRPRSWPRSPLDSASTSPNRLERGANLHRPMAARTRRHQRGPHRRRRARRSLGTRRSCCCWRS